MKKLCKSFILFSSFLQLSFAQESTPFQWFNAAGEKVTFAEVTQSAIAQDAVFFGELHNNVMAHWMQLKLTQSINAQSNKALVLAAEMLETDQQVVLNEFLTGLLTDKQFEEGTRLWPNYKTDYKPLILFAKEHQLKFVAANVPRRYASMVASFGIEKLDSLDQTAKQFLPQLPVEVPNIPSYENMKNMMGPHAGDKADKFVAAQALKDATMAFSIAPYVIPSNIVLHFNGSYHSDHHEGIVYYLKKQKPTTKVLVITTVEQSDLDNISEEVRKKADFILVVAADFPKSY